jgi:hypothetical protein
MFASWSDVRAETHVGWIGEMRTYARFLRGLPAFLRDRITLEQARETVRRRQAEREDSFLRLLRRGIFGYPSSPYRPLLDLAGCELGDVERMLRRDGLETTLLALRKAGVYVTFEEFKGREPIVRGGKTFLVRPHDFDNPYLCPAYYTHTGGTTGAGTRVPMDLDLLADQAAYLVLSRDSHGVLGAPSGYWVHGLPAASDLSSVLRLMRTGGELDRWWSPLAASDMRPSLKNRAAMWGIVAVSTLCGRPVPQPEPLPLDRAEVVARWAAEALQREGRVVVGGYVSGAVRVCVAAREAGLDLAGAVFLVGGEPPTPAKVAQIHAIGARHLPAYVISEIGTVGLGCADPADDNDLHFFHDGLALIQHPRQVPGSDITVDAFHLTTLLPSAAKLMLNVQSDDYGTVERRECGCGLGACGFTTHLRHVRSFRKLTGEGATLVGSDMVRILEEVLPARFGGTPLDYQLLEEEDAEGFSRLSLLINPRVGALDDAAVVEVVLKELRRSGTAASMAASVWKQACTLRVRRREPVPTRVGKLMPLHIARQARRGGDN